MSVWEQRQYDAPLAGPQASQGRDRQPHVASRSILQALYFCCISNFYFYVSFVIYTIFIQVSFCKLDHFLSATILVISAIILNYVFVITGISKHVCFSNLNNYSSLFP